MRNFVIALLILTVACKSTSNTEETMDLSSFKTISKGILTGDGAEGIEEGTLVIQDEKQWNVFIAKINKVNNVSGNFQEIPVDFSKEMVIGIFDRVRTSGGYSMEVFKLETKDRITIIQYSLGKPGTGQFVTTVMTQPYHLVKIKKRKGDFTSLNLDK
jgi:hypothetical protein